MQDRLEQALSAMAGHPVRSASAGRTDAGVHALAQVVHFDTGAYRPVPAWVRGVNTLLPPTIAVQWAHPVPDEFHARFSARERRYRYLLLNQPVRPAILEGKAGWHHAPLDLGAMQAAAALAAGVHDFSAFRAAQCQAKSPVKDLRRITVSQRGNVFVFELCADAFLHHMVRNIVGSLVYVGKGKYPPSWMGVLLEGGDRGMAAPTFAPDGLYLTGIGYDPHWGLPEFTPRQLILA